MTLPSMPYIELALMLELERGGGEGRRLAVVEKIVGHFPDITPGDRALTESSRANKWQHLVDGARASCHEQGHLNGGQRGVWQITEAGRRRIRRDLVELGLPEGDVEGFIRGSEILPHRLGPLWRPGPWTPRPRPGGHAPPTHVPRSPEPVIDTPVPPQPEGKRTVPRPPQDGSPDVRSQLQARIQALTPRQFEHLVGRFLQARGMADVRVTPQSQDGGIDGHCHIPFLGVKVGVQAKRFATTQIVGAPIMQQFKGSLAYNGYERGIFITTSAFTQGAVEVAQGPGVPVVLVDGPQLVEHMLGMGLGIKTIPVTVQEVDEDFFGNLAG